MTTLAPDRLPASAAVRVEGGLLSADVLTKIRAGDPELPGSAPADYGLGRGVRIEDAASRKWNALRAAYTSFQEELRELDGKADPTRATRVWLLTLLEELGYGRLAPRRGGIKLPDRREPYQVSHQWMDHLPVHLLGWTTPLDRWSAGSARVPQSMMQELLNASPDHLWGILSNGKVLRLLRDSTALVGSAYVEFDLEAIFGGGDFSDFLLMYALLHASRLELVPKPEKKRRGAAVTAVAEDEEEGDEEEGDGLATPDELPLTPADCRLEWWRDFAVETGIRSRNLLRDQVAKALNVLGTGFLQNNPDLAEAITAGGRRALDDFHHELLRLAYQLIFLFVAEDRDALLEHPGPKATKAQVKANQAARERYALYFSTARLRRIASRRKGDHHTDLWQGLVRVLNALGTIGGEPALALPELGGLYYLPEPGEIDQEAQTTRLPGSPEPLRAAKLPNERLLEAVRLLSRIKDKGRTTRVDYRHLGAEELGSVYESLLELVPAREPENELFELKDLVAGNKRKLTGSYYTPSSLIEKLLDTALDPIIERYAASGVPDHLLEIDFVDPSCGSGHFLVAAARRIALRYAVMQHGESQPAPERVREAMAKVVRHCVHGVDINPLAAELAKVSLWLESLTPGEPLAYLDDRIKTGNALLGATPAVLEKGIPDGAFEKLEGDEQKVLTELRQQNDRERKGAEHLPFAERVVRTSTAMVRVEAEKVAKIGDHSLAEVRQHARAHKEFEKRPELRHLKRVADVWCASFLWPKHKGAPAPITTNVLRAVEKDVDDGPLPDEGAEAMLRDIVRRNQFFHWHLEFPRVFRVEESEADDVNPETGWQGGFDAVLGNPPWERVKIQKKEWFAARDEKIAAAATASIRDRMIEALATSVDDGGRPNEGDRQLYVEYQFDQRESKGQVTMYRKSGLFPKTGFGDVNTYAVFAEKARQLIGPEGMAGLVLPTGIATDKTTAQFFADLVEKRQMVAVLDMENEEKLFPAVTNRVAFCLFTVAGRNLAERYPVVRLAFRARRPDQLDAREFTLDEEGFKRVNPNTQTAPICEGPEHLRVLKQLMQKPLLWSRDWHGDTVSNPWEISPLRMFDMANASKLFQSAEELVSAGAICSGTIYELEGERYLPLYEGKFIHHFDSRFATYEGATQAQVNKGTLPRLDGSTHRDPQALPLPRHWVAESQVEGRLAEDPSQNRRAWPHGWMLGRRNICRSADDRTLIVSPVPRTAAGDKLPLMLPYTDSAWLLLANLSSRVLDFAARNKHAGVSLSYFVLEQLPVLRREVYTLSAPWTQDAPLADWIRPRILELTYTSYEMAPWAKYLGDDSPPFVWDERRRFLMRAELDAAYFHLYGIERADVDLVLDSFRAFRNKQPAVFQDTKDEIIRVYEAMAEGRPFTHPSLTPPPAEGPRHPPGTSPLTRVIPAGGPPKHPTASAAKKKRRGKSAPDQLGGGLFGLDEVEGGDVQLDMLNMFGEAGQV
ncbi:N-6 DNA methylase [Streptomyces sp. ME02-6978a]|uniref:Eco57I restriction-modification methylase domain-containing protein n=1 Tax=unclassified Streptomyces TaxID=2593676 RepID=UPI0029B89E94|nr:MULTISPECIES: DNA methyltransferase [unclassified Streptomyces]MDX3090697.1 N-6 DNA methylase [Streptomyces sp. ME12-02E]MDX3334079.1 N-6 DNA methylase [Streptomyces sp. ME02-6978a]